MASIRRCGPPLNRLRRRSAACRRRCTNGCDRHEVDTGLREASPRPSAQRVKDLEREVKELRRANEILKLASAFFAQAELDRRLKS